MRELKLLLKVEFKHILNSLSFENIKKSKSKGKSIAFAVLIVFSVTMLMFYAVMYSFMMGSAFEKINALELLPALMMSACCLTTLFTTIYKVKGTLFGFNDYDLLMSLPIKTSTVVFSRILILYSLNFFFCIFLMLPASGVYIYYARPELSFYAGFILTFLLIPMVPIVAASVIGIIIHLAAARFKHKNAVNLFVTLSVFVMVMFFSLNQKNFIVNMADIGQSLMNRINRYYPLAKMYTDGVCKSDIASLIAFIAVSVLVIAAFSFVVGKKFKALNALASAVRTVSDYKLSSLNVSSPFMALYKRELKRYFSSVIYVLNTGVGFLLFTMASAALIFTGKDNLEQISGIPGLADIIIKAGPIALSVFIVLSCTTACAVSLEGKNLWIIKSMPIEIKTIFLSKLAVNLTLSIPAILINSSVFSYIFHLGFGQAVLMYLVPAAYAVYTALMGLAVNLAYPNFTWSTEVTAIKQSAAVILAMIFGMLSVAVPLIVLFTFDSVNSKVLIYITFFMLVIINSVLYRYLMNKGVKTFNHF